MPHTTITEHGARPPVTTQAPDEGIAVGDVIRGTCVTRGIRQVGTVVEICPPLKYSGQHGNRYGIVDIAGGRHWVDQPEKLDPITAGAITAGTAALADVLG